MKKIFRTSTIPLSLNVLLKGQLKFLNNHYEITAISGSGQDLEELRSREGVKVQIIEMKREIAPLKDIVSLIKLYTYFKKERPFIVHSITPKAGLLSMFAARFAGVPIRIHTFTGLIFPSKSGLMQKLLIKMDQLLCWAATNVYPEGNGVREDLLKYKITKKPIKILANGNVNGIDVDFFNPDLYLSKREILRAELNISKNCFVFIFVGRIVKDKGINELIKAFQCLESDVKLLLVGSFEHDHHLSTDTLNAIETNPNIISVGFQQDVRPYFAISDALVFPSYREGFPNVVIQAGAMGLPSIVTDINGSNEIIINNENGLIIPPKDVNSLFKAMQSFLDNPEIVERIGNNSRKLIVDRYQQRVVWNTLLHEYYRLENELLER